MHRTFMASDRPTSGSGSASTRPEPNPAAMLSNDRATASSTASLAESVFDPSVRLLRFGENPQEETELEEFKPDVLLEPPVFRNEVLNGAVKYFGSAQSCEQDKADGVGHAPGQQPADPVAQIQRNGQKRAANGADQQGGSQRYRYFFRTVGESRDERVGGQRKDHGERLQQRIQYPQSNPPFRQE